MSEGMKVCLVLVAIVASCLFVDKVLYIIDSGGLVQATPGRRCLWIEIISDVRFADGCLVRIKNSLVFTIRKGKIDDPNNKAIASHIPSIRIKTNLFIREYIKNKSIHLPCYATRICPEMMKDSLRGFLRNEIRDLKWKELNFSWIQDFSVKCWDKHCQPKDWNPDRYFSETMVGECCEE